MSKYPVKLSSTTIDCCNWGISIIDWLRAVATFSSWFGTILGYWVSEVGGLWVILEIGCWSSWDEDRDSWIFMRGGFGGGGGTGD